MFAWKNWLKSYVPHGLRVKSGSVLRNDWQSYACIEMGGNAYIDTELLVKYL